MPMNVNRLHAAAAPQVQRVVKDAEEKEADFLALRLLNKQARVRLSPCPVNCGSLPGKGVLFATANDIGCFAAATCNADGQHSVIVSALAELKTAFTSSESGSEIPFSPRCTISLPAQPNLLCFASNDSRLVVGLVSGSIAVYDAGAAATPGTHSLRPLHVFDSPTGRPPLDLAPNPGDMPDLVAVLYEPATSPDDPLVKLLDMRGLLVVGAWQSGGTPETTPTSICWSPKGKQVAIGLQSGDIVTFSPNDTSSVKTMVPRPTSIQSHSVISTSWLSNPDFHCIYAPPGALAPDSEQIHLLVSLDSKAATISEVKLASPYLPFPGLRPPGSFTVAFRQWEPTKFLLFVGDSTSSDIGLMGCVESNGQETWQNFTLEETSTPTVPLDQEMNDTILLGLALDLTTTETYTHKTVSGEDSVLPPPPVMYAYASDGTVIGWNILNTLGKQYPGMKTGVAAPAPIQQIASVNMESAEMDDNPEPETTPPASQSQPAPSFGQSSPNPAFSQSAFGNATTGTSAFANPSNTGAFGAFASAGPSKFGQPSSLGVNPLAPSPAGPALPSPMAVSMSNMSTAEETMSTDTPTDTDFGGLSLGGTSDGDLDRSKSAGTTGMFGTFGTAPTAASNPTTPAFGSAGSSDSVLKPATGFGAFGGQTTSSFGFGGSPSASASSTANAPSTPSPAFGSSSFGVAKAASPAFGQSAFGHSSFGSRPAFGQSAFGQSSFGTPSTPKPAFGSSGGFAAFAQGGTASFSTAAKANPETKSAGATPKDVSKLESDDQEKKVESSTPSTSPFATPSTPPAKPTSSFGSPSAFASTPSSNTSFTTPTKTPPSGGAFGNLSASPVGFGKLDSGFGAFGSTTPSSSPFFNPPKTPNATAFGSSTPSALAVTPSAPSTPTSSTKPTFGSPSVFGKAAGSPSTPGAQSPFGTSSPVGASSPSFGQSAFSSLGSSSASAKGFSNFSASGGFGAFAGGGQKSFSDLLRNETDAKGKETTTPKAPVSVFSKPPPTPVDEDKSEGSSKAVQPQRTSVFAVPLSKKSELNEDDKEAGPSTRDEDDDEQGEEDEEDEEDEQQYDDDTGSFISETFSDEEDLPEEHEDEEVDEDALLEAELAAGLALIPDVPTIHLTDSSPPESPEKKRALDLTPGTSTPPGSPDKQPPVAAPVPVSAAASVPFGLGLGRPSTKPTRSSPLASKPISGGDSEDDTTEKLLPVKVPTPAEVEASKPSTSTSTSPAVKTEDKNTLASRPKTPPLTSIFGPSPPIPKPSPFTLAPSSSAPTPSIFGVPPASSPSPNPSDSGAQVTPPKTPSVFSPPTASTPSTKQPESSSSTTPLFPPGGLFGQRPSATPTPPTPSVFGSKSTPSPAPAPMTFPPLPAGGLFGQKPAAGISTSVTPPPASTPGSLPAGGLFGQKPATPPPAPASGVLPTGGLFGIKPAVSSTSTPATPTGGLFGQKPPSVPSASPPTAGQSPFGKVPGGFPPPPATTSSAAPTMDAAVRPTDALDPLAQLQDGMQKECIQLLITMARELEILKREAELMQKRRDENYQSRNILRSTKDLGDPSKFGVGDVHEFNRLSQTLENEFADLKQLRVGYSKALRELETAMLKAAMRKEEIVRFSKANNDAEFAKMLKARTLGPEHLETQTQLRRGIRLLRDRIQKLEEHLDGSKKRLSQLRMGKAGLRPPSLDTINRTYRNIDIAVAQQTEDVSRLAARLSSLDLKSVQTHRSAVDFRSSPGRRNTEVIPNVAATTAAALNAERAAQKLKRSLLKARKEPLLNTKAITAPAPPSGFVSTRKASQSQDTPTKEFNLSSSLWNAAPPSTPKTPTWNAASFQSPESSSSPSPSHRHSSFERGTKHAKPIPLKKSPGAASAVSSSPPPGFSWGPLPGVTPMATLSSDVRKKEEGSKLPFSLSSSWVTEGFDAKK